MRITGDGYVGIANTAPWTTLNLGNCADPFINFGKNTGAGSYRIANLGIVPSLHFVLVISGMLIIILIVGHNNSVLLIMRHKRH
jgi:hypothetical protein